VNILELDEYRRINWSKFAAECVFKIDRPTQGNTFLGN